MLPPRHILTHLMLLPHLQGAIVVSATPRGSGNVDFKVNVCVGELVELFNRCNMGLLLQFAATFMLLRDDPLGGCV